MVDELRVLAVRRYGSVSLTMRIHDGWLSAAEGSVALPCRTRRTR
jgi:hypothetical protein